MNILRHIHTGEIERYKSDKIPSLLVKLKNKKVTKDDLIQIINVRYQAAHFFEDWLRFIIYIIKISSLFLKQKEVLSYAVEQNLKEELGEVEIYGGPHKNGRFIQLKALGIDPKVWIKDIGTYQNLKKIHPAARHLIQTLKKIAQTGPVEAVTALWYYENRISLDGVNGDYCLLLNTLESRFPDLYKEKYIEGDALYHIYSHSKHDEYHAKLAEDALDTLDFIDEDIVIKTCDLVRTAIDRFWDEVLG